MELALDLPATARVLPTAAAVPEDADAALLARVAARDETAFELLYARYVRALYGLALRRLGDRGRAEDAVQEAFTSVWRSARSFRPESGTAAGWIFAVARNATVDRFRRAGEPAAEPPDTVAADGGPDDAAEAEWTAWRIHRALEELPATERSVIELAYYSELSQAEVADFLGIPLGTVKTRTRSGLARLADALDEEGLRP